MDTKQKKPAKAPARNTPASSRSSRPQTAPGVKKQSAPGQSRSTSRPAQSRPGPQQNREYKRSAPQGASVYGASGGSSRPRTPAKPLPEKKEKPTVLQTLIKKGAAASKSASASRARVIQAQKQMQEKHRRRNARKHDTPAVIYTEPRPFNRNKLLVQLGTVAAVVIALVLGLSVFFKVENITVSGAETYSAWAVREASGISEGDNLLTFSKSRASAQIQAALSYVDKVRIGIKLPDTVNIYIEELDVAYAIKDRDGVWWLMTSEGRIVEQSNAAAAQKYTQVLGVALDTPVVGGQALAVEEIPLETGAEGEDPSQPSDATVPVIVTGAQRLSTALQILQALEANDIVGEAASVNVTSINSIELWYGQRYQVNLGDSTRMEYKIACMNDVILQMSDYQTGRLDISFTTWADQVGYTPFS